MSDQLNGDRSEIPPQPITFDEFHEPTYEEWYETTVKSLKGASFEKKLITRTYEGIDLQPMYRREDIADIAHRHTLPGQFPFVRGTTASGYLDTPWLIAQAIAQGTPQQFNEILRHDLERGQTAINLVLDTPSQQGIDPDLPEGESVGQGGVSIAHLEDLKQAFEGVDLENIPVFVQSGLSALAIAALFTAYIQHAGKSLNAIQAYMGSDPLAELVQIGQLAVSLEQAYDEMAELTRWARENAPNIRTIAIQSNVFHDAGASAVEELAFAMATGVAYIRALLERRLDIDTIAQKMYFTFSVGANFFGEVAKLRAAHLLWAKIVKAFGGDVESQKLNLHVRTSRVNKTVYDPYVNMLRTTVEGFAGAIGGCQSMHIAPFDDAIRPSDEFSRRIARNQQLVLQRECNLTNLIDPAGGSWYVEYLTDQFAKLGWGLFQQVEEQGGLLAALQAGFPQQQIANTAEARQTNFARRKDVLVGTNMYPNLSEERLKPAEADNQSLQNGRGEIVKQFRERADADESLQNLSAASENLVSLAIEAASAGASLGQITSALRNGSTASVEVTPLPALRIAEAFEKLREAANIYKESVGHAPRIFLASMGSLAQHKARTDFTIGFYEVGGFEMLQNPGFETVEAAAVAALASAASAVVICSTDDVYVEIVPSLTKQLKAQNPDLIVILAGYPQDQVESYKEAGVDEFIHIRANCYDMNRALQEKLGVKA